MRREKPWRIICIFQSLEVFLKKHSFAKKSSGFKIISENNKTSIDQN